MIAETSYWDFQLTDLAMRDRQIAREVGILAAHGYGSSPIRAPKSDGERVWHSEVSSQSPTHDGSIQDGIFWALKIHHYLTIAKVNAWSWWFLSDGPKYGDGTDNSALTDINLNFPKQAYVIGQWSRFVRPGWHRIGVGYSGRLRISAFKNPTGRRFAIVVVNPSRQTIRQAFVLKGFSVDSLTSWITSANLSLAPQAAFQVNASRFTYRPSALSVTTLAGAVQQNSKS